MDLEKWVACGRLSNLVCRNKTEITKTAGWTLYSVILSLAMELFDWQIFYTELESLVRNYYLPRSLWYNGKSMDFKTRKNWFKALLFILLILWVYIKFFTILSSCFLIFKVEKVSRSFVKIKDDFIIVLRIMLKHRV